MHKLLPFRQYDEKDVLNLFKLDLGGATLTGLKPNTSSFSKKNWSGTAVDAKSDNNWYGTDPAGLHTSSHTDSSYLGAIGTGDQGFSSEWGSFYPEAPMAATASTASGGFLGITLRPTLAYDENDEKLLYYNVKKDELQAVIPGEAVPVVTRGFFTLTADAVSDTVAVGDILKLGANGTFTTPTSSVIDSSTDVATDGDVDVGTVTSSFGVGRVLAVGAADTTAPAINKPAAIFVQILGGIETA
jgi:hypothetical protein